MKHVQNIRTKFFNNHLKIQKVEGYNFLAVKNC